MWVASSFEGLKLAVPHARTGGHVLKSAGADDPAVAHRVLVLDRPLEDERDDLHVPVRVGAEALAGRDAVVVDDAQAAEAEPPRVVIVGEAEGVVAVQPPVLGVAAFVGSSSDHSGQRITTVPDGANFRARPSELDLIFPPGTVVALSPPKGQIPPFFVRGAVGAFHP
jgi:hypothetical protein